MSEEKKIFQRLRSSSTCTDFPKILSKPDEVSTAILLISSRYYEMLNQNCASTSYPPLRQASLKFTNLAN